MQRSIDLRLRKLEAHGTGDIPVWCDDESDVASTISEMIAAGKILESDRSRCVYWANARCRPGAHERRLEAMEGDA
jgi:hypothetical protein